MPKVNNQVFWCSALTTNKEAGQAGKVMSYLGTIKRLYTNLKDALRWAHKGCRVLDFVVREIDASNAPDELKAQASAVKASMMDLCEAIDAFYQSLH